MQMQKHILSQVLRSGAVPQKMIRDAEHHRLMLAHDAGESEIIAASRLRQSVFSGSGRR
jgi:hypothetical protein